MNGKVKSLIVSNDNASPASAPLIVVSNRLPFVLKRDGNDGKLRRFHRYRLFLHLKFITI